MKLFSADLDTITLSDLKDALAIDAPEAQRPTEGVKIDYKRGEPDNLADTVASFANTAGGLIFIGVESTRLKHNVPVSLPGETFAGGDIKARLADKLLAQISPRPKFDIGIVPVAASGTPGVPAGSVKAIAAIRVQEGIWPPYESTIGSSVKQPIRILDTTRQATLRELEQLFQRRRSSMESPEERFREFDVTHPLNPTYLAGELNGKVKPQASTAYQTWLVQPRVPLRLRLDRRFGARLKEYFMASFPDANFGQFHPSLLASNSHILRWQARIDGSPRSLTCVRWLECRDNGGMRFAEKIDRHDTCVESVSDLFIQSMRFWELAQSIYRDLEYYGSLSVMHRIDCTQDVIFVPSFPNSPNAGPIRYVKTDVLGFPGNDGAHAQGSSCIVREVEAQEWEDPLDMVCDFMLGHLGQLCQANIDYEGLKALVAKLPGAPVMAFDHSDCIG